MENSPERRVKKYLTMDASKPISGSEGPAKEAINDLDGEDSFSTYYSLEYSQVRRMPTLAVLNSLQSSETATVHQKHR